MAWLGGDMNVSIRAVPTTSADSVRWMVTLSDPTAMARGETVNLGPVARSAAAAVTDSLVRLASRGLWQLDHTPRRPGASAPPGTAPMVPAAPAAPVIKKP
jgi:hypothetical protein